MQYPEFEDPFNVSEDTIKNMIEDPNGRQRIQAYMQSLSDQLFKTPLASIRQLNQEWAFPHQETMSSQDTLNVPQEIPEIPISIEKKEKNPVQEDIQNSSINAFVTQELPQTAEQNWSQTKPIPLNKEEFSISDTFPEETPHLITSDSNPDLNPTLVQPPDIQTNTTEKEQVKDEISQSQIDGDALEKRYRKRQETLEDLLKRKGNIS